MYQDFENDVKYWFLSDKTTSKEIAEYFGLSTKTIANYMHSEDEKIQNRYFALKKFYVDLKYSKIKEEK